MIAGNMSNEIYHSHPAISRSNIVDFMRSPKEYMYWKNNKKNPTRDMEFGSAFHAYVLEHDKFINEYDVEPQKVLLRDVGREAFDEYKKQLDALQGSDKKILTQYEMADIIQMAGNIGHQYKNLLFHSRIEHSIFWTDPESGLEVKARPDAFTSNVIIDLKTIRDASENSFRNSMAMGGYHIQAAMVIDGLRANGIEPPQTVINICCEKTPPYHVGIYILDDECIETGRRQYKETLIKIKECTQKNEWQDLEPQIVGLPDWYRR